MSEGFKITKFKPYRINFTYNNKHYSINESGELYEEWLMLSCKEDKELCENLGEATCFWTNRYIKKIKFGQTYKQTDLSGIKKVIDKYILKEEQE